MRELRVIFSLVTSSKWLLLFSFSLSLKSITAMIDLLENKNPKLT